MKCHFLLVKLCSWDTVDVPVAMLHLLHSLIVCRFIVCLLSALLHFVCEQCWWKHDCVLVQRMVQSGMDVHVAAGCFCKCILMLHELLLKAVLAVSSAQTVYSPEHLMTMLLVSRCCIDAHEHLSFLPTCCRQLRKGCARKDVFSIRYITLFQ